LQSTQSRNEVAMATVKPTRSPPCLRSVHETFFEVGEVLDATGGVVIDVVVVVSATLL
jgi:hypothetical protein